STSLAAPSGLIVVASSSTEIDLGWTASSGGSGSISYMVESCPGSGCSVFAQVGSPSNNSFNNPGLSPNTVYSYRVRATDTAGDLSSYSNVITITTAVHSPDCN